MIFVASIGKRPDGKYRARYRDAGGKEHSRHFTRKGDAQRWLDEVTTSVVTGMYADPVAGKITFTDFYRAWSQRQVWEHTTRRGMDNTAKHVTFGDVPLGDIRRSHIESWVKAMTGTLAASTIKTRMSNVRAVIHAAIADKIIISDPTLGVRLPKVRRKERALTIPTPEQVQAIMIAADDRFRPFVALCAFAGLRHGETAAVQVGDIDYLRRTLHVVRQAQHGDGGLEIRAPKHGSERDVYLPDDLLAYLSTLPGHGPEGWLFVGANGMPPGKTAIAYHWGRTLKRAGLSGIRLHDLRHFYVSGLIAAGCDVVAVQRAVGHGSSVVTLGTYGHLWPTAEDRTRNAAGALWSETVSGGVADYLRTRAGSSAV